VSRCLMLAIGVLVASAPQARGQTGDTLPRVTLDEALRRATDLDVGYVQAVGDLSSAEWGRRAAKLSFVVPSLTLTLDATKFSDPFFNAGIGGAADVSVTGRADARLELFSVRRFAELSRSAAAVDFADAGIVEARFAAALGTEALFYDVLANDELRRVAEARAERAGEAFGVARARVVSGAAVQSDSLQLLLELTQARTDLLRQRSALRVARLQLGRRIGQPGPVDAVPLDSAPAATLPLALDQATALALEQGPQYRAARASERAANAVLRSRRGEYLPTVFLSGAHNRFDDGFFPGDRSVSSLSLGVTLPVWNGAQREIGIAQATASRDVARAIRSDLECGARADVTEAYEAYDTARETVALQETAVAVARENYRVQEARYRGGAAEILDLLDAQVRLTQAEANLVQARYATRLALAGLETILGRRLFTETR
jgi:outer membrane protein TolC